MNVLKERDQKGEQVGNSTQVVGCGMANGARVPGGSRRDGRRAGCDAGEGGGKGQQGDHVQGQMKWYHVASKAGHVEAGWGAVGLHLALPRSRA